MPEKIRSTETAEPSRRKSLDTKNLDEYEKDLPGIESTSRAKQKDLEIERVSLTTNQEAHNC